MSAKVIGKAGFAVEWEGLDGFVNMLEDLAGDPGEGLEDVVEAQLERIGARADFYCPKDTHSLVDSRQVWVETGRGIEGAITYGGGPVGQRDPGEYALYVHEDPTKYHEPPTRFKFLEVAYAELGPSALRAVADAFGVRINRAGRAVRR